MALPVLAQRRDTITVAVTGDIMMGSTYPTVQLPPQDGRLLFSHVIPIISAADIAAGNLEGTLCDGGTSTKRLSKFSYAFRTPVNYVSRLKEAGYDFLSMANNHVNDFGDEGIASTADALKEAGLHFAGIKGQYEWTVFEKDGIRYGFCAFGHNQKTCDHRDLESVRRIVTELCNQSDIVIVSIHGGAEGSAHNRLPHGTETFCGENRGSLRELTHFCIDAGADIVYGHGPHVLRAVELYKGHFIAYSLGNFCTPYGINLTGISGYAPVITLRVLPDGCFVDGRIHSFIQRRGAGPQPDPDNKAAKEIKRLTALDVPQTPLRISDNGEMRPVR